LGAGAADQAFSLAAMVCRRRVSPMQRIANIQQASLIAAMVEGLSRKELLP
jgi:hypothetical protein